MAKDIVRRCPICRTIELEAGGETFLVCERDYGGNNYRFTDGPLSIECFKKMFPKVDASKIKLINGIYETCRAYD